MWAQLRPTFMKKLMSVITMKYPATRMDVKLRGDRVKSRTGPALRPDWSERGGYLNPHRLHRDIFDI